jgi:hypothetical protein
LADIYEIGIHCEDLAEMEQLAHSTESVPSTDRLRRSYKGDARRLPAALALDSISLHLRYSLLRPRAKCFGGGSTQPP